MMPVRIIKYEGTTYIDLIEFVDIIVRDLMKAPVTMVATRDEIIYAVRHYAAAAQKGVEHD